MKSTTYNIPPLHVSKEISLSNIPSTIDTV